MNKNLLAIALILTLISCGSDEENKPVMGDSFFDNRVKKISAQEADDLVNKFFSKLPPEIENNYWPRNGYVPGENLKFTKGTNFDSVSVGGELDNGLDLTSAPVIAEGVVFTLGGNGEVQAREVGNISNLMWETKVSDTYKKDKKGYLKKVTGMFSGGDGDNFIGGNISYSLGTLYISTRRGYVFAISAKTGETIWSRDFGSPIRSIPIARETTVAFVTSDNRTIAINGKNGETLWHHQGIATTSRVFSSPSPLLIGDKLIVTYSSGEIFAIDFTNGIELWSTTVATSEYGKLSSSFLSDISLSPVYHNGLIYVVSSDGTMNAIDINGNTVWAFEGKSINHAPWGVGDFLFTTTRFGELLAISAHEGKMIWKNNMAEQADIEDDGLQFTGLIVAAGNIYAADNNGTLYSYSPKTGATVDKISIPSNVYIAPVVASGGMYFLTRDSNLVELK